MDEPIPARAVEWRGAIGSESSTQTHIVNAKDEDGDRIDLVVKFKENLAHTRGNYRGTSLACELICSMIGRKIGLHVPDYYVVELTGTFVNGLPNKNNIIKLFARNKKYIFGTPKLSSFDDWPSNHISADEDILEQFAKTICFDGAVMNGDRRQGNPNVLWDVGKSIKLIDHALALATVYNNSGASPSPSQPFPKNKLQDHAAVPSLRENGRINDLYSILYGRWGDRIDSSFLSTVRSCVPDEWERTGHNDIDKIFCFLDGRDSSFNTMKDIISEVIS